MKFHLIDNIYEFLHPSVLKRVVGGIVLYTLVMFARLVLRKYQPHIIGITGSVGKTSTKDLIYTIVRNREFTWKSIKSYNHGFGLPLAVLGLSTGWNNPFVWAMNLVRASTYIVLKRAYPKTLVLELGVGAPGDLKQAMKWVKPDVAVVTSIGTTPVHVEFFESPEMLVREKTEVVRALPDGGIAILNRDDESVYTMRTLTKAKVLTYGFSSEADFRASHNVFMYSENNELIGITFRVDYEGKSIPVRLRGVLGRGQINGVLAAPAPAISQGVAPLEAVEAIERHSPPPGRARILPGVKGTTIIDDTYNSSPVAVHSMLEAIKTIDVLGRKIAVLGDMMELGQYTKEEHEKVGVMVASVASELFVVGQRAAFIAQSAEDAGMSKEHIFVFDTAPSAGVYLEHYLKPDDLVLIKGSQAVRLERIVEEIMAEPENKEKLLVRQEPEWKKR